MVGLEKNVCFCWWCFLDRFFLMFEFFGPSYTCWLKLCGLTEKCFFFDELDDVWKMFVDFWKQRDQSLLLYLFGRKRPHSVALQVRQWIPSLRNATGKNGTVPVSKAPKTTKHLMNLSESKFPSKFPSFRLQHLLLPLFPTFFSQEKSPWPEGHALYSTDPEAGAGERFLGLGAACSTKHQATEKLRWFSYLRCFVFFFQLLS